MTLNLGSLLRDNVCFWQVDGESAAGCANRMSWKLNDRKMCHQSTSHEQLTR